MHSSSRLFALGIAVSLSSAACGSESPGVAPQNPDSGVSADVGSEAWCPQASADTRALRSVWGSSESDVWAVGDDGAIAHFDGAAWSLETRVNQPIKTDLYGVWGTAKDDVWAVGQAGAIAHFDGAAWSVIAAGGDDFCRNTTTGTVCSGSLRAVWGSGAKDVWAVGKSGGDKSILSHWDGAVWSHTVTQDGVGTLLAVNGTAADDAWAVGAVGQIWHKGADAQWTSMAKAGEAPFFTGVWSIGKDEALAGTTAKYSFNAIAGKSASDLWAVGGFQGGATRTVFHYDGKEWKRHQDAPNAQALNAIFVDPASGVAFAVGDKGTVLRYGR
jgi:hypothetical protein